MAKPKTLVCLSLILWSLLTQTLSVSKPLKGCIAEERVALLSFKEGLEDPANRLSTWRDEDCCAWRGVVCNNKTGYVARLDLRNKLNEYYFPDFDYALSGKLSSSLVALRHLNYLDLSMNLFNGSQIPEFIGSMSSLTYLNLSGAVFGGNIPPQLGNLSNLLYLDLSYQFSYIHCKDLAWLPRLSLLEHLDMSDVNISTVANWAQIMSMLPSLKHLSFAYCGLQKSTFYPSSSNLSNLATLDIGSNSFGDLTSLNWVFNLTSLKYLDMSWNNLKGDGILAGKFNNLCNIKGLDLSYNPMNKDITELVRGLPQCFLSKLQSLNLGSTNLVGNLSSLLEHMIGLSNLDLSYNNLTGSIPHLIHATKLSYLDLSLNPLDGVVSKHHFANLSSLQTLYLYGISIIVDQNWVPPIALRSVSLNSCKVGPKFPSWVKKLTNIINLDLSNTSIVDKAPDWLWNLSSHLMYLDLSNNQISGNIRKALQFMCLVELYLNNNRFEGSIPELPQYLYTLDISNNSLSGPFSSNLGAPNLRNLILQKNLLTGTIPASICQLHSLRLIALSNNLLTGPLPACWTNSNFNSSKHLELTVLTLRNNSFSSTFPSFLKYCKYLSFLDLSYNKFSGNLPSWVGEKLPTLSFLLLRSNRFSGNLSIEITKLSFLRVLDLAHNNFSGNIPHSINTFEQMRLTLYDIYNPLVIFTIQSQYLDLVADSLDVVTKGTSLEYNGDLLFMTSIDLSLNSFTGEIPEGICSLTGLRSLNLSENRLIGSIPGRIGAMQALESLDLSSNDLSGEIPFSLSNITWLSHLNLSYNNLSGRIPSGYQLQTLDDPSIYVGNSGLCGPPLSKNCSRDGIPIPQPSRSEQEDGSDAMSLYLSICIAYILGLWLVFCVFLFKKSCRVAYFRAVDDLYDWIYVLVVLSWKRVVGK